MLATRSLQMGFTAGYFPRLIWLQVICADTGTPATHVQHYYEKPKLIGLPEVTSLPIGVGFSTAWSPWGLH